MEKIASKGTASDKGGALRIVRFRTWVRVQKIRSRPYHTDEVPGIWFPAAV